MSTAQHDVLIIGAGLSGIGAACHLRRKSPQLSYQILERRQAIGGTWDLFRYPGIRSDSDMCTFGYSFRPWNAPKILADGPAIRDYVRDTAEEYGVTENIRFGRQVQRYDWDSDQQLWTVSHRDEASGTEERSTARFLIVATGYYNYDQGYMPDYPGAKDFGGQLLHPQHWPEDLDYSGKKVVVIGSGATAITLVPSMAGKAAKVTMLQRSPTYIMSVPSVDPISARLRRFLPDKLVYGAARARNIGIQRLLYLTARQKPKVVRRLLRMATRRQLGADVDMKHFTPRYNPWDERLCVVPDGDLFKALRKGKAEIVTDEIERFCPDGIRLKSGALIEADIVVSATGLQLQMGGGAHLHVDGEAVPMSERMVYRGCMLEGVPNAAMIFGYTNASWTLKADLVSEYICRLLNHMRRKGLGAVQPRLQEATARTEDTVMGALSSGYVRRGKDSLPKQGRQAPWTVPNDYFRDIPTLKLAPLADPALEFLPAAGKAAAKGRSRQRLRAEAAAV